MADTIGLLVVHGIGRQSEGDLCREVACSLSDAGQEQAQRVRDPSDPVRITMGFVQVVVAEANWAGLSSPDNPPCVRLATPIVRDYLETVPAVWRRSRLRSMTRRLDRRTLPWLSTILLVVGGLLFGTTGIWNLVGSTEPPEVLTASLGIVLLVGLIHLAIRNWRYRRLRLRRAPVWRRLLEPAAWAIASLAAGVVVFLFAIVLVVEFLLFFAVPVAVAYVAGYLLAAVAAAIGRMAGALRSPRLAAVKLWIHRLAWVMLVLPCHAFLQSIRAAGNLLSIVVSERRWRTRIAAIGGLVGVYFAFLILLIVCEIFLFPVLMVVFVWSDTSTAGETVGLTLVMLAMVLVYILILKLCLPAIDLLLDVANYHLADAPERGVYHGRIEDGIAKLRNEGCSEIHVLAHSLGTVLVYDWLHSAARERHPIAVLYTIGSPLDKFWYLDHGVSRRLTDRAGMGAHVSRAWINFWSRADPVSGQLVHYHGEALRVVNERIDELGWFPVSHVRYWKDPTVLARVRTEIVGADRAAMT